MRPAHFRPHAPRALLSATVLVGALLVGSVVPAAAVSPGPIGVPALTGFVTDACTGLPVAGLSVGVTSTVNPGLSQAPGIGPVLGLFVYPTVSPGPSQLTVSAPGYVPLGATPAGGAPGVAVTVNPGPPYFPDGASFASGLLLDIRLQPLFPPSPCSPAAPLFPAVSGRGVDAATGRALAGLTVALAPIISIDPTTGEVNPGPTQQPSGGPLLGLFSFRDPGPVQFGFQFYATAPNHTSLGADPTHPPSPNGPGVAVMSNPGPIQLPAGSGAVNQSVVLAFALPAGPAGG
jgi:hypothetical protein